MATSEQNAPRRERILPVHSLSWQQILLLCLLLAGSFLLMGAVLVASIVSFQVEHSPDASTQAQGRLLSMGVDLSFLVFFLVLPTFLLLQRLWLLGDIRRLPFIVLWYACVLGAIYNELAYNLPGLRLATLEQIAPGLMALWNTGFTWLTRASIIGFALWYVAQIWRIHAIRRSTQQ
jgi:hypothetical protein